jgi:hypothetical protein
MTNEVYDSDRTEQLPQLVEFIEFLNTLVSLTH